MTPGMYKKRGGGYGFRQRKFRRMSMIASRTSSRSKSSRNELKRVDNTVGAPEVSGSEENGWIDLPITTPHFNFVSGTTSGAAVDQRQGLKVKLHSFSGIFSLRLKNGEPPTLPGVKWLSPMQGVVRVVLFSMRSRTDAAPAWTDLFSSNSLYALRNNPKEDYFTVFYDRFIQLGAESSYSNVDPGSTASDCGTQGKMLTFRVFCDLKNTPASFTGPLGGFDDARSNLIYVLIRGQSYNAGCFAISGTTGMGSPFSFKYSTRVFFYD